MGWKDWPYWLRGGIIGGISFFLIWFWDYDFLINAGGPNPRISDYIRNLLGINNNPASTLLILTLFGIVFGILIGYIYGKFKNRDN